HLEAWDVRVESLHRLRVVEAAVDAPAERRPDHDRAGVLAIGPVADARRLAHDLVEGRVDEVRELDLRDRYQPVQRGAYGDADDARLCQRGVQYACLAELAVQALGGQEHAALLADVLAQHPDPLVAIHLLVERLPDALDQGLDSHLTPSSGTRARAGHPPAAARRLQRPGPPDQPPRHSPAGASRRRPRRRPPPRGG